jgi:catechol 2,3-dioxygenase-like lactoylglutathione lyase family enzyme
VKVAALDHIVLCVADVPATIAFYERGLGMAAREERPGKWSTARASERARPARSCRSTSTTPTEDLVEVSTRL